MGKFKVGDYVLATGQIPAGEKGFVRDIDGYLYAVEFDTWRKGHRCDGLFSAPSGWKMLGENLAHASWDRDPRALRIREGRYYKTRDGRKVGPMRRGAIAFIVTSGDGFAWRGNGKCHNAGGDPVKPHDLVAEWDEPVAPARTKFKVGDRVRFRSDLSGENSAFAGKAATIFAAGGGLYDWSVRLHEKHVEGHSCGGDVEVGFGRWADSCDLEPVEKADAPLLVSITADTSALDAEIDRVKARLDDLEAHAARLGVKLGVSDLRDAA